MMSRIILGLYYALLIIVGAVFIFAECGGFVKAGVSLRSIMFFTVLVGGTIVTVILPWLIGIWLLTEAIRKRKRLPIIVISLGLVLECAATILIYLPPVNDNLQMIYKKLIIVGIISNPTIILTLLLLDIFFWQKQKLPS